jgi:hypothetical protein
MNTKRLAAIVVPVSLVIPALVMAALSAPTGLVVTVDAGAGTVNFDWADVVGAVKYSVDVEGMVTYTDTVAIPPVEVETEVELSFGTSDRTDGGDMADSDLTVTIEDLAAALAAQLGITADDLISLDASAKVKALAPGKGAGSQNNPFSDPAPLSLTF